MRAEGRSNLRCFFDSWCGWLSDSQLRLGIAAEIDFVGDSGGEGAAGRWYSAFAPFLCVCGGGWGEIWIFDTLFVRLCEFDTLKIDVVKLTLSSLTS